jgi:hypothetical protein
MTIYEPQLLPPAHHDDPEHEHAWRRIDAGNLVRSWSYRCDVCHRTWAALIS